MNEQSSQQNSNKEELSNKKLICFFLPLASTPLLISSTHSIINAALARLPFPEMSIAIYNVVRSLTNVIKGPDIMARQTAVSFIDDRESYLLVMKFVWALCSIIFAVLLILGFTPLGGWVLRNIIGLTDNEQISFAYSAMRITCFLPISEALRNSHQGLAIGLGKTSYVSASTAIRLVSIVIFLWWAVATQSVSGIIAGSLTWTVGIGIEGLAVIGFLIYGFGSLGKAAENRVKQQISGLNIFVILKYFIPLALMRILATSLQPVIQSGIARSPISPTRSLAAYGVAWGLVLIFTGPLRMLHQCSLVYGKNDREQKIIYRFCLMTGIILSSLLLIIGFSPIISWILQDIIAVSKPIANAARPVFLAFAVYPLAGVLREYYWGIIMQNKNTKIIGIAKAFNLGTVFLVLTISLGPLRNLLIFEPAVMGAAAFTAGETVEALIIRKHILKISQQTEPEKKVQFES